MSYTNMENVITVLSEDLVDKIAAGEVVERPASVVKELVENSIDAGAKNIIVEIKNGGVKLIRVADDGIGMDEENSVRAFQRHATSKIKVLDDLFQISTLGFRGEALPSIASVSFLDMLTRTRGDLSGTHIRIEGGIILDKKPMGVPIGTSVAVRELFYNVPARRKFLKTILTETRHIIDLITKFAIAYPEICFKLDSEERELFVFPSTAIIENRISEVFGRDKQEKMIKIKSESGESTVKGFLGKPEIAPSNRAELYLFVNRRAIVSRVLYHAVQSGYGELLPKGRYPWAIAFIQIDPGLVDVNVHPTKNEVRFADERGIHDLVHTKVKESLTSVLTIPEFEIKSAFMPMTSRKKESSLSESEYSLEENRSEELLLGQEMEAGEKVGEKSTQERVLTKAFAQASPGLEESRKLMENNEITAPKVFDSGRTNYWQLADTYILSQVKGNLMVLDQHAAHERILYEEALRNLTQKPASSQQILFPAVSDLTPGEFYILEQHKELIQKLGFEIKHFGGRTVLVTAVPALTKNRSGELFLKEILIQLETEEKVEKDKVKALAKSFACHAAIKAGERLNQEEMENLVHQIFTTEEPYSCPHGRPTIIKLTMDELNRKFGRS